MKIKINKYNIYNYIIKYNIDRLDNKIDTKLVITKYLNHIVNREVKLSQEEKDYICNVIPLGAMVALGEMCHRYENVVVDNNNCYNIVQQMYNEFKELIDDYNVELFE